METNTNSWSDIVATAKEKLAFYENRNKELLLTLDKAVNRSATEEDIKRIENLIQQNNRLIEDAKTGLALVTQMNESQNEK
jgi:hypothetical protein